MKLTKQGLKLLTALLFAGFLISCSSDKTNQPSVEEQPNTVVAKALPEVSAPITETLSVKTINATPSIALYPLLPAPELLNDDSVGAKLAQLDQALTLEIGRSREFSLLDRSNSLTTQNSPERKSLATGPMADYVLTGLIAQQGDEQILRLQLSHVASHRLVAVKPFPLDNTIGRNLNGVADFLESSIEADRDVADSSLKFNLSLAGILPSDASIEQLPVARTIQEAVTERLLSQPQYTLMSTELAYALYLETHRAPQNDAVLKSDIIVSARILDADSPTDGLDLVLFLDRIRGLRKVIPLHAQTPEEMANLIVASIKTQLNRKPEATPERASAAQAQLNQAWSRIYKNGKPFVNGFPNKITDKNRTRLAAFTADLEKVMELDPSNYGAIGAKALLADLPSSDDHSYAYLQQLLWDERPQAFDFGVSILNRKIQTGANIYFSGVLKGLPEFASEQDAIAELVRHGWLSEKDKDDRYWWSGKKEHAAIVSRDADLWDYVLGIRNPDLDSLARYKTFPPSLPIHQFSRPGNMPTGIYPGQSIYYALANTIAPLALNIGKNGFFVGTADLEVHKSASKYATHDRVYLFQSLAGMSTLSNSPAIEPDLLYAASLCHYHKSFCTISHQMYESISYRAEGFRQYLSRKAHNPERATLYAESLIEMARSKIAQYSPPPTAKPVAFASVTKPVQRHKPTGLLTLQDNSLQSLVAYDVVEPCEPCTGLTGLRGVYSSPGGKWLAKSQSRFDGPRRYQATPKIMDWMFNQGYLDIAGQKTQTRLPRKTVKPLLQKDFPALGEEQIRQIMSEFDTSHYKVRDSGRVKIYQEALAPSINISSPDVREEARFGEQVSLSHDKAIVCDQWGEGYQFFLFDNGWDLDREANEFCDGSQLALVDEWRIKARRNQLAFYTDDANGFTQQQVNKITTDFETLPADSFIENVRAHGDLTVVKVRYRSTYYLLVYQLLGNQWAPASALEVPQHFYDFAVFDHSVYQLIGYNIVKYNFKGNTLTLDSRYPLPEIENRASPHFMLLVRDSVGEKLVVHSGDGLSQVRL